MARDGFHPVAPHHPRGDDRDDRNDRRPAGIDLHTPSALVLVRAGAAYRNVDHLLGDHMQFDVLVLTDLDQLVERLLGTGSGPATDDADRLVNDRPATQRALRLLGPLPGLHCRACISNPAL